MELIDLSEWHDVDEPTVRREVDRMLDEVGDRKIAGVAMTIVCSDGYAAYFTRHKLARKNGASDLALAGALEKTKQRLLRQRDRTTTEWDDGA